ncbi:hypothetical protein JY651_23315 [Pyxidicoccus parkwayensis]|uniref:DUF6310 domain-containing protein n=1 Tax=Pyxidicoccus parkwayensis TaxID=2813578 RepID=A0ABX7PB56_9BACT|nr:DUF6310 domain-containing protein [Pyxidicoccus parkwaysis]QSQ27657.1 hypothetical protein JY651_23315 [Pyxidicoccus parkwaysis]
MLHRTCIALLLLLSACATMEPSQGKPEAPSPRLANLQRAALYPWTDDGHCVVREASNEWPILAERCFQALDRDRIRFRDVTKRCAVANADAAAPAVVALCVFAAPEIVVGAVIVIGAVVVAATIQEGIDAYQRNASHEREKSKTQTLPSSEQEPVANSEPTPKGSGPDWLPPISSDPSERPECRPIPGPPRGGNEPHDECANKVPGNDFPGLNVLITSKSTSKSFDALVLATRTLWEVKTYNLGHQSPRSRKFLVEVKLPQIREEARLAKECGYNFVVGVTSAEHKALLRTLEPNLTVVVMDWC